ncbi:hydroxymethylglutaryl-CoA lyase [Kiloniella sp. b19]|uniref:hydroxymethylglutaryl-CoA lyase n=1 Tax=Kiloniella sp. GXU_MW_B19 TaxID=3141326 RepID=UPI0031D4D01E
MAEAGTIRIVEVGPRDGLQNEASVLSVEDRVHLIRLLFRAGLSEVEAGAFVSPKAVPQMQGSAEVLRAFSDQERRNLSVLVPNQRGLEDALAAGAGSLSVFTAVSDSFALKNIGMSVEDSLGLFESLVRQARDRAIPVRGYLSCVAGCPFEGTVDLRRVVSLSSQLLEMGCFEVSLGDTIGVGTPVYVKKMLRALQQEVPLDKIALHCHNTYGQALANVYVGLEEGIHVFDSAVAGLGGCPFAPGASGNLATEDLLYMLGDLGGCPDLSMTALLDAADFITKKLGKEPQSAYFRATR